MFSVKEGERAGLGQYPVTLVTNYNLCLSDGVHLALAAWFPAADLAGTCFKGCTHVTAYQPQDPSPMSPQPVILEYLPYRKSEHTYLRDMRTMTWFSSHGYVGVRVDFRGAGDSEGLYFDEYAAQEQKDGLEVSLMRIN